MNRTSSFATLLALLLTFGLAGPADLTGQTTAPVPVAEAQAFLGEWTATVENEGQAVVIDLNISDEGGNVAAVVTEQMSGSVKIEQISKDGEKLVLGYTLNAQGQPIPILVTLTAEGEALNANIDVAAGMFVSSARATRK